MTTLTLSPDFDDKKLTVTGKVSVGEKVDVIVTGVTEAQSASLRVRFRHDGVTVARYPLADGDVWTYASSTATANMDLNTDLFRALFEGAGDRDKIQCVIIVDNTGDLNQYAAAQTSVGNWPVEAGADVPYSLSEYPNDVAALQAAVTALEEASTATNAAVEGHTHQGGASQVLAHNNLTGIGTNTHAQIDAALTAIAASQLTVSNEATELRNDLEAIKDLCDTVKAMPTAYAAQREARFAALIDGLIDILT